MSLDVYLYSEDADGNLSNVFDANVTHNLNTMADAAGMYEAMWRPEEMDPPATTAKDITPTLEAGLLELLSTPEYFRVFNPKNGWGSYEGLVRFTRSYLDACKQYPSARIETWR